MVINVSIVVDEKANKLGHKDLLFVEGSRKEGDTGGIPSLRSSSNRVCHLVGALSRPNLNAECAHKVGCLVNSAARPIHSIYRSLCITGERGYDAEDLLNLTNICENLPRRLNGREHHHSHLTTVVTGAEGEEGRLVLKI